MKNLHFVNHIVEPKNLLLVWQSPDDNSHKRLSVAILHNDHGNVSLNYLIDTDDFKEAVKLGFKGYSAFEVRTKPYDDVMQSFSRRLPPRKREDFNDYLESFRISPGTNLSDFALLGYTGAKLPSDSFLILHTFEDAIGSFEFLLEAAGFRFENLNDNAIQIGQTAEFKKEYNENLQEDVIEIKVSGHKVGYVTRALVPMFSKWLDENKISNAFVEKKNGSQDKPVLFLYITVNETPTSAYSTHI